MAVRANETPRGREGRVVEILARGKTKIVGQFRRERGIESVLESGDSHTEVLIGRGESRGAKPGDMVCDPFTGSGTTGIASVQLGRRFHGVEISGEFKTLAEERIAAYGV